MDMLEFYRIRNDLTQEDLGRALGVSKQTVFKWEKRLAPISRKHFSRLKEILRLSEAELLQVVAGADMNRAGDVGYYSTLMPEDLARHYRILRQRREQASDPCDKMNIDEELAKLDLASKQMGEEINERPDTKASEATGIELITDKILNDETLSSDEKVKFLRLLKKK